MENERLVQENNLSYSVKDKFPVTDGHSLIIPKRHFPDYFEITQPELNAVNQIILLVKKTLISKDSSITGFNTVSYTHLTLPTIYSV